MKSAAMFPNPVEQKGAINGSSNVGMSTGVNHLSSVNNIAGSVVYTTKDTLLRVGLFHKMRILYLISAIYS